MRQFGGTYGSKVAGLIGGCARNEAKWASNWTNAAFGTHVFGKSTLSRS